MKHIQIYRQTDRQTDIFKNHKYLHDRSSALDCGGGGSGGASVVSIKASVSACSRSALLLEEKEEGTVMFCPEGSGSGMFTNCFLCLLGLWRPVPAKSASVSSISACYIKNRLYRV